MEVKLAKTAGFCFGVRRAMDIVEEQIKKYGCENDIHNNVCPSDKDNISSVSKSNNGITEKNDIGSDYCNICISKKTGSGSSNARKVYTYGPIIHNSDVINDLKKRGVGIINSPEEIKNISGSVLIIRAHGVSEEIYRTAVSNNVEIVDATCPFVEKIHRIACKKSLEGYHIIILGDKNHPEIQGITGWTKGEYTVIKDAFEAENLTIAGGQRAIIVVQTTFDVNLYKKLVEIIKKKGYDITVLNTICNATANRQKEAAAISESADMMLVIGDRQSANTKRLYEICKANCKDTYFIQNLDDLECTNLQTRISVGITAGASTPNNIIQEVFLKCQKKKVLTS